MRTNRKLGGAIFQGAATKDRRLVDGARQPRSPAPDVRWIKQSPSGL